MPMFRLLSCADCCCSVVGDRNEEEEFNLKSIDSTCYKAEQAEGGSGARLGARRAEARPGQRREGWGGDSRGWRRDRFVGWA
jgi:hypothetical protein